MSPKVLTVSVISVFMPGWSAVPTLQRFEWLRAVCEVRGLSVVQVRYDWQQAAVNHFLFQPLLLVFLGKIFLNSAPLKAQLTSSERL